MLKSTTDLEKELLKWREARAKKQPAREPASSDLRSTSNDRRTVRVNGQEVVVVKKGKRSNS
jgi:hypothetical protein